MSVALYPPAPAQVDKPAIEPSASFKKEVFRVLLAIFFFILTYITLAALAVGLAALCAVGGVALIAVRPSFITLMLGLGMIALGGLVVFFLFKFLFARSQADNSGFTEVTPQDQPMLFNFVKRLTEETKTQFPKKIYVTPDVNASVFYHSSLWSMFFPVRKNLQIGLGLVNSVNLSEFKAILAHEFGHFSQRSMKLGSYVYNVNRVIYNMLYDNEGYGNALQRFANVSGYFAFFANITSWIIRCIQWVLKQVYGIVNKTYMGLSRQMEFHADSVAASVSGSKHLVTSLRRLELAESSYQTLLNQYQAWIKQHQKPDNLYPQHSVVMLDLAQLYNIPVEHGLPQVNAKTFARFNRTRVVIKDQWASHPSTDDRENHLNSLNLPTETLNASAWSVFRNAEDLQKKLTERVFESVRYETEPQVLALDLFQEQYKAERLKYQLDDRYKGYFNNRPLGKITSQSDEAHTSAEALDSILNDEAANLPQWADALAADLETVQLINNGSIRVRNFDFDGRKYKSKDTPALIQQLTNELEEAKQQLEKTDKRLAALFLSAAAKQGQKEMLERKYQELDAATNKLMKDLEPYHNLIQTIQPIYYDRLEFDHIRQIMTTVKLHEVSIKDRFKEVLDEPAYQQYLTPDEKKLAQEYIAKEYVYFYEPDYNNQALETMSEAASIYNNILNERVFAMKKALLEEQLRYL